MLPTFREATATDAPAIARLHADSWRRNYRGIFSDDFLEQRVADERRGIWTERLAHHPDPRRFVLLADLDGDLVGFICAYGDEHPQLGSLIDNLHVVADHQRSGIGRELMRRAGEWLSVHFPNSTVYLDVLEQNERAIKFYDALGGARIGPMTMPSADGTMVSAYHVVWKNPRALVDGSLLELGKQNEQNL